jgi:hypothetical protein
MPPLPEDVLDVARARWKSLAGEPGLVQARQLAILI